MPASDLQSLTSEDRILVIAPHPDDEAVCCAGTIAKARAAGAYVAIVWLTMGDAFELDAYLLEKTFRPGPKGFRKLGARRFKEAQAAAEVLGVPADALFLLGYPDRGLAALLVDHYAKPYQSPYTQMSSVWYLSVLSPGASYEGRNLERDLIAVLKKTRPTFVLAPSPADVHSDHRAAGELAIRVLRRRGELNRARYWVVHAGSRWPAPRGLHIQKTLPPPPQLQGMRWQTVDLIREHRELKLRALYAHATQLEITPLFLTSFVRKNELFARRPLPVKLPGTSPNP
jgi:LmbE family N-acetylglucosaminyl deacetylase